MAATVTIDKAYFETLLRRAEFHATGEDHTTPVDLPVVTILKVDHDNLLQMVQEYTALRDALYRGGISPETLEILIHNEEPPQVLDQTTAGNYVEATGQTDYSDRPHRLPPSHLPAIAGENDFDQGNGWSMADQSGAYFKSKAGMSNRQHSIGRDDSSYLSEPDKDDHNSPPSRPEKPRFNRAEQRTIAVHNLSDRTTHKDIVEVVRGGALLDIYLRVHERSASISFVEGSAAQEFMNHVKRNDIYIHGKRLEFAWNDRQFLLPAHVANKISTGASRNLIVRGVHPSITEQRLREDLDHIHNLVVISVSYNNGNAYLSLNSVHNALFARTCMMSRAMYKGMKIEWYPDKCALPLPKQQWVPRKESAHNPIKRPNHTFNLNRFQMLNMDGTEDGSDDEIRESETESSIMLTDGFSAMKMNHRSPWNASVAA